MRSPKQKQPYVKQGLCRVLEHVDVDVDLSYLIDWLTRQTYFRRQMPNKVIVTSLWHLDMFHPLCQNGGK